VRLVVVVFAVLVSIAAVAGCASGDSARSSARGSSTNATDNPSVVDGITIPPIYVTPKGTVVPGPDSCPPGFSTTLSQAAAGADYPLTTTRTANLITCTYTSTNAAIGDCSGAKILINTEPQAFKAFDRWNVETGQNSMWTNNPALRPTPIDGIGIEAEWAPALLELGTGNDTTWVSVIMTCPGNTPAVLALAEALAKQGLASTA
jgi:hypothetical protein